MKLLVFAMGLLWAAAASAQDAAPTLLVDRLPTEYKHGGEVRDTATINMIVIHAIGGPYCTTDGVIAYTGSRGSAVKWRDGFLSRRDASIHYVVDRDGAIAQQRPEDRTAGHVASVVDPEINRRSIGIEMTNDGDGVDPFPEAQVAAMVALVKDIAARYHLGPDAIRTHAELEPRTLACGGQTYPRRTDPGPLFPMDRLKAAVTPPTAAN